MVAHAGYGGGGTFIGSTRPYPYAGLLGGFPGTAQGGVFGPNLIAGLVAWYRADAGTFQNTSLTTPASANNDPVGGWVDQSGLVHTQLQSVNLNRPLLQTNSQNGLPQILADGVSQFMTAAFTLSEPFTVFMTGKVVSNIVNAVYLDGGANALDQLYERSANICTMFATGNGPEVTPGLSAFVIAAIFNGASSQIRLNAGAAVTGNPGTNASEQGITLFANQGGTHPANVLIGEVVVYNSSLSIANETKVRNYLNSRWAVY